MPPFQPKAWKDLPDRTTPITSAALIDMETRLSDYTDAEVAAARAYTDEQLSAALLEPSLTTIAGSADFQGPIADGQYLRYDGGTDMFVADRILSEDVTMMRGYGHSIAAAGGSTIPYAEHGYMDRIAGRLGVVIEDRAKGGAIAVSNEWGGASTTYNGGWGRVFMDLARNTRTHAPYQPDDDLVHINFGLNDVPVLGPTVALLEPFRRAYRSIISRIRASAVFEDTHASIAYGGAGWFRSTGYPGAASNGDWTQTPNAGATVTITVPAETGAGGKPPRHDNATVVLAFPTGADGSGALWDISVDGVHHGTLETRNMNGVQRGHPRVVGGSTGADSFIGMNVYRIAGLSNAQHTIVATATAVQTNAIFDCWWVEAAIPPRILATRQQYPIEIGYQLWQGASYNHNATTLAAAIAAGAATATVTTITQMNGYPSMRVGDTFTVEQGTPNQETFSIGAINGNVITLAGGATFANAHPNGASVIAGWQDYDVDTLNQIITDVVAEFDDVRIMDANAAVGHRADLMSDDAVHPNDLGHSEIERQALIVLEDWAQTDDQKLARSRGYLHGEMERRVRTNPKEAQSAGLPNLENTIQPQTAAVVPLTLKGAPSQSGNLFETRDSAGALMTSISSVGTISTGSPVIVNATSPAANQILLGYYSVPIIHFGADQKRYFYRNPTPATDPIRAFTTDPTAVPFATRGAASQSVPVFQTENSAGTVLARIDATGQFAANVGTVAQVLVGTFAGLPAVTFGQSADTIVYRDSIGSVTVQGVTGATRSRMVVKMIAAQSVSAFEVQDSSGNGLFLTLASGANFLKDTTTPAGTPTGGGYLYSEGGDLKWKKATGDVVVLS